MPGRRLPAFAAALLVWMLGFGGAAPGRAAAQTITVRVSVKIIRNPVDGSLPPRQSGPSPALMTHADVENMVATANASFLQPYWRGYRFAIAEIVDIGSTCTTCSSTNPSYWYDKLTPNDNGLPYNLKSFETTAKAYAAFHWSTTAVNVFFNEGMGNGAVSSFPPPDLRANETNMFGSQVFDPGFQPTFAAETFVHETGHFFSLNHPQTGDPSCCTLGPSCVGDGDGLADTLADGQCFDRDDLSLYHFSKLYGNLAWWEQVLLDDEYENVMVYNHPDQPYGQVFKARMTELQCDAWTDTANAARAAVRNGVTRFVATNGNIFGSGSSSSPLLFVNQAIVVSAPSDIVLVRPGVYAENLTLNTPVTIRATRQGAVTIGN